MERYVSIVDAAKCMYLDVQIICSLYLSHYITCLIFMLILKGGSKLERSRDLFEQCLEKCPAKFAKSEYNKI